MPGNLSLQFPYVKAIVEAMGIPSLEKEGFEADDIIATCVRRFQTEGAEAVVVTSDKDLMQLACDSVTIYDSMKNVDMGREEVAAKFGIDPCLIPDLLALSGDTSDNIPGVPGIGDKTAREPRRRASARSMTYMPGSRRSENLRSGRNCSTTGSGRT